LSGTNSGKTVSVAKGGRMRWIVVWIALGTVLILLAWGMPKVVKQYQAISCRQQCLDYQAPPDQVVFEEDPAVLPTLANVPLYEQGVGGRLHIIPQLWKREDPSAPSQGTIFLHARTSPSGHVRLVALDVNVQPGMWIASTGDVEDKSLLETVIVPGQGFSHDTIKQNSKNIMWICPSHTVPMRFFAGQPDPTDASHFTVDYQRSNSRATLDGYLNDDDSITLKIHQGSLTDARPPVVWDPDGPTPAK
jgi:hypothetical protein